METRDLMLDGNAIGGLLLDLFGLEMTDQEGVCGSCGAKEPIARLHVYMHAPGIVVRCCQCQAVVMRIVRSPERTWLDFSGTSSLELKRPM